MRMSFRKSVFQSVVTGIAGPLAIAVVLLWRGPTTRVECVVSLTSFPPRIKNAYLTVLSLLFQSRAPERIILTLSLQEFPRRVRSLPMTLRLVMMARPTMISVIWVETNDRSYKKLVPAVGLFPNLDLVTVDDDVLYPRDWLASLLEGSRRFPGMPVGTRGFRIPDDFCGDTPDYATWRRISKTESSPWVFLTGRGGILYPPGSLSTDVLNIGRALELCPCSDDLWFKTMSLSKRVPCAVVPSEREYLGTDFDSPSLHVMNVGLGGNDEALRRLEQAYGFTAMLSRAEHQSYGPTDLDERDHES